MPLQILISILIGDLDTSSWNQMVEFIAVNINV